MVTYLVQHHGTRAIDGWYADAGVPAAVEGTEALPELPRGLDASVDAVMAELRIRSGPSDRPFQLLSGGPAAPIPAVGYDFVVAPVDSGGTGGGETGGGEGIPAVAAVGADTLSLGISADGRDLLMSLAGREEARGSLAELIALAEALRVESPGGSVVTVAGMEVERREVAAARLVVDPAGDRWSARVALRSLTLRPAGDRVTAESFVLEAALLRAVEPSR